MSNEKTTAAESLKSALAMIDAGRTQLQDEVAELTDLIQVLRAEESKLLQDPISFEDYSGYMKAEILKRGERFATSAVSIRQHILRQGMSSHAVATPHKSVSWKEFENGSAQVLSGILESAISGDELCYFFGDALHKRLVTTLLKTNARNWGNENAVPSSERVQRLEIIGADIAQLLEKRSAASMQIVELDKTLASRQYS